MDLLGAGTIHCSEEAAGIEEEGEVTAVLRAGEICGGKDAEGEGTVGLVV